MSLHTLILAAGEGRRFGDGLKQLAVLGEQTLLARSVQIAQALTPHKVTVVLGYQSAQLSPLVTGAECVINAHWQKGIGSSIAFGVQALPISASAVLIMLCDQAALTISDLTLLCNQYFALERVVDAQTTPIVCASYEAGVGVPAIFPRRFFPQLMALNGDSGAKALLQGSEALNIPLPSAAIDIDTQDNLTQFKTILATQA